MRKIKETIYKQGKSWRGKLIYDDNGSTKTKWFRGKTSKDVEDKITDFLIVRDGNLLYGDFIHSYFEDKAKYVKQSTYYRLRSIYRTYCIELSYKKVADITCEDIKIVINHAKLQKKSKSVLDKIFEFYRNSLQYAVQLGIIDRNPVLSMKKFQSEKPRKQIQIYSKEEIRKLQEYCDNSSERIFHSVPLLWCLGLRMGELLALEYSDYNSATKLLTVGKSLSYVSDYDCSAREIIISTPKTVNSVRSLPCSSYVVGILEKCRNYPHICSYPTLDCDSYVISRNFDRYIHRMCSDCGIEFRGIHAFRHTFATTMLNNGVPVEKVSKYLGHASVKTTIDIYCHIDISGDFDNFDNLY